MSGFDPKTHDWKPLVPELIVSEVQRSLAFWQDPDGYLLRFAESLGVRATGS